MASASFSSDALSEAIQKYLREKVAKKIRKRKESGWEEVHREMKSCELANAIQSLPPELREIILKECIAAKIKEKNKMGWDKLHEKISQLPLCELKEQIVTKISFIPEHWDCDLNFCCLSCYEKKGISHKVLLRQPKDPKLLMEEDPDYKLEVFYCSRSIL